MTAFLAFLSFRFPAMADPAASSTSRVTRPTTTRRRARAASSPSDALPTPAASEPGTAAPAAVAAPPAPDHEGNEIVGLAEGVGDPSRALDSHDLPAPPERLEADLLGAMETLNLDPRQGTLAGFELPADALESLRSRAAAQRAAADSEAQALPPLPSSPAVAAEASVEHSPQAVTRAEVIPQPAGARIADIAAYLRVDDAGSASAGRPAAVDALTRGNVPAVRRRSMSTPFEAPASSPLSSPSLPSKAEPASADSPLSHPVNTTGADAVGPAQSASTAALADTVAALSRALAEERRAAAASRRRTARLLAVMACASVLVLALAVAQFVVLARVARESAAMQQKTEALLRSQQLALAAFLDTASGAAADIRGTADALAGRLAALPSRQGAAQGTSSVSASTQSALTKHSRSARVHKGG